MNNYKIQTVFLRRSDVEKNNVRMRGRLRAYLYLPVMLTPLLIMINIPVYMQSVKSGFVVSGFVLLYFLITLIVYLRNKPLLDRGAGEFCDAVCDCAEAAFKRV